MVSSQEEYRNMEISFILINLELSPFSLLVSVWIRDQGRRIPHQWVCLKTAAHVLLIDRSLLGIPRVVDVVDRRVCKQALLSAFHRRSNKHSRSEQLSTKDLTIACLHHGSLSSLHRLGFSPPETSADSPAR